MEGGKWEPKEDGCAAEPCAPNGRCMDLHPQDDAPYECQCDSAWVGTLCDQPLACASSPCQAGGGVCDDRPDGSFVCVCHSGYAGDLCDQVGPVGTACATLELQHGQVTGQCVDWETRGGSCFLTCTAPHLLFADGALVSTPGVSRTCQADGTWTGTMPTCERPDCGATAVVAYNTNGVNSARLITCDDTLYGGADCSISCETGYELSSGPPTLSCSSGGVWTGDAQCGLIDCGSTIVGLDDHATATCSGDTQYGGDDCTATCDEGWKSAAGIHRGTATFSCDAHTKTWSGSLVCSAMTCGALVLDHGSVTTETCSGTVGDSCVMLGCDTGYSLSHAAGTVRECQPDGTWSGFSVTCVGIPCTTNTVIANSDRVASNPCVVGTGSACIFACDAGYRALGVHT